MRRYFFDLIIFSVILFFSVSVFSQSRGETKRVTEDDYRQLQLAMKSNNEGSVVESVSKILSKDDKNIKALNSLALFYFNRGKLGISKLIYNRAFKSHKDHPGLHNNLGVIYLEEGDLPRAMISFKRSISLQKSYSIAKNNLSSIAVSYYDYSHAIDSL